MLEILALPFFQRALLVGIIVALMMAMMGVLVVLRKMSFFSDAIGHSALAGIAGALLLNVNPFAGAISFAILVAFGISGVRRISNIAVDTLLGVLFPASVAIGVILVSLSSGYQADLISFLFGNILTVSSLDIIISLIIAAIVAATFIWIGKSFVAISFDPALARAEGIPVSRYETFFLVLLAAVIALAIKFVGIVLVTALLITPAATAQNISRSLSGMFFGSIIISVVTVILGMLLSVALSLPSGPVIVLSGATLFLLSLVVRFLRS